MSVDKEEYIESSVSLEGKYPQFTHEGDENADAVIRFEPQAAHRLEIAHSVTEDIGGELQLYFSQQGDKLAAICFRGAAKRWKFERVSLRFEEERDLVYMRFRWFLRQEMSLEIEELDEDLVLDLDKKDRVIGFAITNASKHFNASMLNDLRTDNQWIRLASYSTEFASIDEVKAAKKAKKTQKRALATEAARVVATPSPSVSAAPSGPGSRVTSPFRPKNPQQVPKKKKVYTKVSLIPVDGIVGTCNTDESDRTYYTNRFVRDLEWTLNFPFILRVEENGTIHLSASALLASYSPATSDSDGRISPDPVADKTLLSLVQSPWVNFGKPSWLFLADLDRHPEKYIDWIRERIARSNNLGGYFTLLIEFLLSNSINIKTVLAKHQVFSEDKRTVGDFDFLIQLKATPERPDHEPWIHWEVGIKFYLNFGDAVAGLSDFIGPHCTGDSLEKYIAKTVRQLDLGSEGRVADKLRADGKFPFELSQLFLKGYVFYPLTQRYYEQEQEQVKTRALPANSADVYATQHYVETNGWLFDPRVPTQLNGGPICGWWVKYQHKFPYNEDGDAADPSEENLNLIREDDSLDQDLLLLDAPPLTLSKQDKLKYSMWTILNKMDYMAPLLVTPDRHDVQLLSYARLKSTVKLCLATNYRSLFVAEVVPYSRSQYKDCPNPLRVTHVEVSRGFIVGEHWPTAPADVLLSD